jgi:hypothetical protein
MVVRAILLVFSLSLLSVVAGQLDVPHQDVLAAQYSDPVDAAKSQDASFEVPTPFSMPAGTVQTDHDDLCTEDIPSGIEQASNSFSDFPESNVPFDEVLAAVSNGTMLIFSRIRERFSLSVSFIGVVTHRCLSWPSHYIVFPAYQRFLKEVLREIPQQSWCATCEYMGLWLIVLVRLYRRGLPLLVNLVMLSGTHIVLLPLYVLQPELHIGLLGLVVVTPFQWAWLWPLPGLAAIVWLDGFSWVALAVLWSVMIACAAVLLCNRRAVSGFFLGAACIVLGANLVFPHLAGLAGVFASMLTVASILSYRSRGPLMLAVLILLVLLSGAGLTNSLAINQNDRSYSYSCGVFEDGNYTVSHALHGHGLDRRVLTNDSHCRDPISLSWCIPAGHLLLCPAFARPGDSGTGALFKGKPYVLSSSNWIIGVSIFVGDSPQAGLITVCCVIVSLLLFACDLPWMAIPILMFSFVQRQSFPFLMSVLSGLFFGCLSTLSKKGATKKKLAAVDKMASLRSKTFELSSVLDVLIGHFSSTLRPQPVRVSVLLGLSFGAIVSLLVPALRAWSGAVFFFPSLYLGHKIGSMFSFYSEATQFFGLPNIPLGRILSSVFVPCSAALGPGVLPYMICVAVACMNLFGIVEGWIARNAVIGWRQMVVCYCPLVLVGLSFLSYYLRSGPLRAVTLSTGVVFAFVFCRGNHKIDMTILKDRNVVSGMDKQELQRECLQHIHTTTTNLPDLRSYDVVVEAWHRATSQFNALEEFDEPAWPEVGVVPHFTSAEFDCHARVAWRRALLSDFAGTLRVYNGVTPQESETVEDYLLTDPPAEFVVSLSSDKVRLRTHHAEVRARENRFKRRKQRPQVPTDIEKAAKQAALVERLDSDCVYVHNLLFNRGVSLEDKTVVTPNRVPLYAAALCIVGLVFPNTVCLNASVWFVFIFPCVHSSFRWMSTKMLIPITFSLVFSSRSLFAMSSHSEMADRLADCMNLAAPLAIAGITRLISRLKEICRDPDTFRSFGPASRNVELDTARLEKVGPHSWRLPDRKKRPVGVVRTHTAPGFPEPRGYFFPTITHDILDDSYYHRRTSRGQPSCIDNKCLAKAVYNIMKRMPRVRYKRTPLAECVRTRGSSPGFWVKDLGIGTIGELMESEVYSDFVHRAENGLDIRHGVSIFGKTDETLSKKGPTGPNYGRFPPHHLRV